MRARVCVCVCVLCVCNFSQRLVAMRMCKFASLCVRPCRVECVGGGLARLRARVSKSERTHARMRARAHTHIIDHASIWPGLYLDQQGLYLEPRQKGIDRIFFSRWARVFQMMVFRYIRYIMLSVDARVLYTMACFW